MMGKAYHISVRHMPKTQEATTKKGTESISLTSFPLAQIPYLEEMLIASSAVW